MLRALVLTFAVFLSTCSCAHKAPSNLFLLSQIDRVPTNVLVCMLESGPKGDVPGKGNCLSIQTYEAAMAAGELDAKPEGECPPGSNCL